MSEETQKHCKCCRRAVARGVAPVVVAGRGVVGWLYFLPARGREEEKVTTFFPHAHAVDPPAIPPRVSSSWA
jgi:hypothetical protein